MIKYRLRCFRGHEFETWFQNSATFDTLAKRDQLSCAVCGTERVDKALMAPRLARSRGRAASMGDGERDVPFGGVAAPARPDAVRAAVKALRAELLAHSEYVGNQFADRARAMHDDEEPSRVIHGEASMEETRELLADGIAIFPLPPLADDHN